MRILFATAHPYIPQIAGGAQSSTHELALNFKARGHTVAVAAGLIGGDWLALKNRVFFKLSGKKYAKDEGLGYAVYRSWFVQKTISRVIAEFRPDIVFAQSGFPVPIARECNILGVPIAIYLRNVEHEDLGGDLRTLKNVRFIANSQFTANWFRRFADIQSAVVYPVLDRSNYESTPLAKNVTFINPHPHKGSELALDLACRCPEIPFVFVEAWTLDAETRSALTARIAQLSNVTLRPRTVSMRDVYRDARIVIVPSKWDEAFGRVAAEAHFSGIPVVAANRGGLPEAVGPGGLLIDSSADPSEWVAAVRRLWNDDSYWRELSDAAKHYSDRDELNPERQIEEVLRILSS